MRKARVSLLAFGSSDTARYRTAEPLSSSSSKTQTDTFQWMIRAGYETNLQLILLPEASMKILCSLKVTRGSLSLLRKSFRTPQTTWMS